MNKTNNKNDRLLDSQSQRLPLRNVSYLGLRQSKAVGKFSSFGKRQILRALKVADELLHLVTGEDGTRFTCPAIT